MHKLDESYGKKSYEEWDKTHPSDLRPTRSDFNAANREIWPVSSFRQLFERVTFLATMNKRLVLYYRGQTKDWDLLPTLFRDSWNCFDSEMVSITSNNRKEYWRRLEDIGQQVYKLCDSTDLRFKLPRRRGFGNTREIQWAVIQHYGLWPTPLIDVTSSLRVAATFAMNFQRGSKENPRHGFLYVVGMPHTTGSITFDHDQHIVLVRLQSACPPLAERPHYQDGFLVGNFPIYTEIEGQKKKKQSNLLRRLVAKFELRDNGDFWDEDFPIFQKTALLPDKDELLKSFIEEFGHQAPNSIHKQALELE